jgi:hypothetical protein
MTCYVYFASQLLVSRSVDRLKAMRVAFFALMAGARSVIVLVHFPLDRFAILQAQLFAVVVAELAMLGARLVYYRRDV